MINKNQYKLLLNTFKALEEAHETQDLKALKQSFKVVADYRYTSAIVGVQ